MTQKKVEANFLLGPNKHGNGDAEEIIGIEKSILEDEAVRAEIAKLQLPKDTVIICDPWIYGMIPRGRDRFTILSETGSDGIGDDERLYQCFLYMRDPLNSSFEDSNHYALPLPISPVIRTSDLSVIRIDIMPTGDDHTVKPVTAYEVKPPNEYMAEYQQLRTDLKPLNVVQPEGASFSFSKLGETGELIQWQKWFFRVGFNVREGMVIYDVSLPSQMAEQWLVL